MKARYILEAIAAMKAADRINYSMEPHEFGTIKGSLAFARINLEVESGLRDVEIEIEKGDA